MYALLVQGNSDSGICVLCSNQNKIYQAEVCRIKFWPWVFNGTDNCPVMQANKNRASYYEHIHHFYSIILNLKSNKDMKKILINQINYMS